MIKYVPFFLADWCGYCKEMKREKIIENLANNGTVVFVFDDKHAMGKDLGVRGFPSIMCWKGSKHVQYEGERTPEGIMEFMKSM